MFFDNTYTKSTTVIRSRCINIRKSVCFTELFDAIVNSYTISMDSMWIAWVIHPSDECDRQQLREVAVSLIANVFNFLIIPQSVTWIYQPSDECDWRKLYDVDVSTFEHVSFCKSIRKNRGCLLYWWTECQVFEYFVHLMKAIDDSYTKSMYQHSKTCVFRRYIRYEREPLYDLDGSKFD